METTKLKSASFEPKKVLKLPKGAEIIYKEIRFTVEEIENGYIIRKSCDIKWKSKDDNETKYDYITKSWYSEKNPLSIDESLSLADKFD